VLPDTEAGEEIKVTQLKTSSYSLE